MCSPPLVRMNPYLRNLFMKKLHGLALTLGLPQNTMGNLRDNYSQLNIFRIALGV